MTKVAAILSLVLTLLLGADATLAQKTIETGDFSGWMDNYEMLTFDEQRNAFIFENEVKQGVYKKVMFDSLVFQGEGLVTNPKIAGEANQYLEQGIRDILQRNGIGATAAGAGVLRAAFAVSGVKKFKEGLKPYHILPVAAVFRGAQEASGSVDTYIDTRFEGEIVDSVTGERIVAIVAKGVEDTSKRSGEELVFDDVIPTLDKWLAQLEENLQRNLAAR